MADAFDPYHRWLGIRPEEQPPNYYRLLGITVFEDDPEVVRDAAEQRMSHVRTYQLGEYSEQSQAILNELGAARATLLTPEKKANYDRQLQAELAAAATPPKPLPVATAVQARPAEPATPAPVVVASADPVSGAHKRKSQQPWFALLAIASGVILFGLVVILVSRDNNNDVADSNGEKRLVPQTTKPQVTSTPFEGAKSTQHEPDKQEAPEESTPSIVKSNSGDDKSQEASSSVGTPVSEEQRNRLATEMVSESQPPPSAVAPFDEGKAREYQQQWADYLGLPLEWEDSLGIRFVLIPAGEFTMGSAEVERQRALEATKSLSDKWEVERIPTEGPQHRVRITRPFYLGKYEVTQAQWEAAMGSNPSTFPAPSSPVEQVSWIDVQSFLAKVNVAGPLHVPSAKTGVAVSHMKYALPTEAQWEYACRAGTTTAYSSGADSATLWRYAWFVPKAGIKTHPVGELKANPWSLHDMHGNVWEWCLDWYEAGYYVQSPAMDPPGPKAGSNRVLRGGSFNNYSGACRSAFRHGRPPGYRRNGLGFRLALVPADE